MNSNEPTQCAEAEKENELTQEDQSPSESREKGQMILGKEVPEDCPIGIVIA